MRRTYKSKKDTGGTLDPRDVLQNMDEKSSAFDAFYIQNIKQTKRELSCVASAKHSEVASNKVRKRKYVKRILKVEPARQRETMSSSAYLTPDKSIRVNKVLDPFDMLLNSSPVCYDAPEVVKDGVFERNIPKKTSKIYTRKKRPKVKKFNYSTDSTSIESDKENASDSQSNTTDIRTHELLVVKESSNSPKYLDESINKIVNNLSLLNHIKRKGFNGSFNTSYKTCRNRPTKFNSPILQKSPLCSTPFKEKYRGISIFKFSPIIQKESPNNVTISEEKEEANTSIILGNNVSTVKSQLCWMSPLALLPNLSINKPNLSTIENNSNGVAHDNDSKTEIENVDNEIECKTDSITNIEQSAIQTTEEDVFLGFSINEAENDATIKNLLLKCLEENKSIDKENVDDYEIELKTNETTIGESENISISSIASNKCNTSQSSVDSQCSDEESLYDTCNSEQSSLVDDYTNIREPTVVLERMNDSVFMKYYAKMPVESDSEEMSEQTENNDFESLANDSIDEVSHNSLSAESNSVDSKPNAIVITDSSTTEDILSSNDEEADSNNDEETCVSFVTTRRRNEITNDTMFIFDHSYGSNSIDCDKTVLSNLKINLDKSDVNTNTFELGNVYTNLKGYVDKDMGSTDTDSEEIVSSISSKKSSILSRQTKDNDSVNDNHDLIQPDSPYEAIISRVSTRKSSRLLRQSVDSTPNLVDINNFKSPTINKKKHKIKKLLTGERMSRISTRKSTKLTKRSYSNFKLDASKNETTFKDANDITVVESNIIDIDSNDSEKAVPKLSITNKSISSVFKRNDLMNHPDRLSYAGTEVIQPIVLQPGKKWERSLSIYRRMTMVADSFDQSILDDECRQKKGRKYRQSVINTMEMQECWDSLHNDSINSRRSTFISKPGRPTVRFVKDPNISIVSLNTSSIFNDLKGFLNEECDDTVIELSKLSIADSEHEVTILDNFHEPERVATARDYVLRRCKQTEPILFDACYPETVLKNCHKIGEGVYGEVFLWRDRDGRARVMKIVPIAGNIKVNGEDQKDFHEIISEIVIAMELSALRAPIADIERQLDEGHDIHDLDLHAIQNASDTFNEVLAVRCVYGAYPSRLLDLWELYDECRGSENDSPAALPADQRYIVLELANAGQDLESYQFASAQQAHALFQQIALGLAVAEESFQFEHRDLHWGNVLIAPTEQKLATFVLRGRAYRTARCGVSATVIDYSLSRLTLPLAPPAALYNDLAADEQLFDAVGDYQFEVYRLMRDKLGNDWKNFEPYTNILWLHYTVDKMITALRYKRTNTKIHKHYIEKLKGIKNRILEYGSAVQYVLADIEF